MTVVQIRKATGLTQRSFAEMYKIPLQTLKQWEAGPESSAHREPPEYVVSMLNRLVSLDYGINPNGIRSRAENLIAAAEESRYNAALWMRYLRKEINDTDTRLTADDLKTIIESDKLTMFQKITLKRATEVGTSTNKYITALNKKAGTPMVDDIMRRLAYVEE